MNRLKRPAPTSLLESLTRLPCWNVSTGGAVGPTFQLAFGRKLPRAVPLKNARLSREYRHHEGEANLLVWCAWRLDSAAGPITSSDEADESVQCGLGRLLAARVQRASLIPKTTDLRITFSNGLKLSVFCDHVGESASLDGNWELWRKEWVASVGVDLTLQVQRRLQESTPKTTPKPAPISG